MGSTIQRYYFSRKSPKGTRIMVKSVLYYVAQGKDWNWISQAYLGKISREAITEAVSLASEALLEKAGPRRRAA
jgi:uncharacterized protein (DUF433 family)